MTVVESSDPRCLGQSSRAAIPVATTPLTPMQRFRKEADALASLQHPNIVQVYDAGEQDGEPAERPSRTYSAESWTV